MAGASEDLRRLREALAELVADDVPELLAEARTEARSRVRAVLAEVMAEAMLEEARRAGGPRPASPTPVARQQPLTPQRPGRSDDRGLGYYVYGVTKADFAPSPDAAGIDPAHAVETLAAGDLAALVSQVPLTEFNEDRLREHFGDIAWVETTARRHEEVLEAASLRGTVIPMRLCSLYRDAEGVRNMLEREAGVMHDALQLLDGRAEWAVKVFAVSRTSSSAAESGQAQPDSGAAYLAQQSRARRHRETVDQRLAGACEAIHHRLSEVAVRAVVVPPQRPEVSGHDGEMVLNGVYLVDDTAVASFHEVVTALEREFGPLGVELVSTGPWPAYNFVPDAIGVST